MRLKRSRVDKYFHRSRRTQKDKEGNTVAAYDKAVPIQAEVWCAGGKLQAEMYGEKLPCIRNIRINGKYTVKQDKTGRMHYKLQGGPDIMEGDGLCLYVSGENSPDYRILSIKPERFLRMEAEKL